MKSSETQNPKSRGDFQEVNQPEFLEHLLSEGATRNTAFRRLVQITHDPLLRYVQRFVSSLDEAQEVLQEVYMAIHKGIHKFQGRSKLTTWIYSMAHYKACDRIGDRNWQHEELTEYKQPNTAETPLSKSSEWDVSPEKWMEIHRLQNQIQVAATSLPLKLREVYTLRDLEGFSGKEAAEVLNVSEEAIRVRLHRARQKIIDFIQQSKTNIPKPSDSNHEEVH